MAVVAIAGGIAYLRAAKARDDRFTPRPPSIEVVRIAIQHGTDKFASSVIRPPKPTTYAELRAMERPPKLDSDRELYAEYRVAPLESRVWKFQARVVEAQIRRDNDLYLVIEDNGLRGCVEVPPPELCRHSPFYNEIAAVRKKIESDLHPSFKPMSLNRRAEFTGIGFFGTAGKGENGARLLPLLSLKWLEP